MRVTYDPLSISKASPLPSCGRHFKCAPAVLPMPFPKEVPSERR